jgi:hypothetical protein
MKSTEVFKQTIKGYLDNKASSDALFQPHYIKENKNLDDCCTYILNWVKKSGVNGFTDEEIYGQAVHYYTEDTIEIGDKVDCQVVVNHTVELTEEEKEEARKKAIEDVYKEAKDKLTKKPAPTPIKKEEVKTDVQQSLF